MRRIFALCVLTLLLVSLGMAQSKHEQIKSQMALLSPLLGSWEVTARFEARSGKVRNETGTYHIDWALDSTYFQWKGEFTYGEGKQRQFMCWITYDIDKGAYKQLFMYSKSARQIAVEGSFNQDTEVYTTKTTISHSDGTTEWLRSEWPLNSSGKITQTSYARFGQGGEEVMNYIAEMSKKVN